MAIGNLVDLRIVYMVVIMAMFGPGTLVLYCASMYNDLVLNTICIQQQHGGVTRAVGRKSNQVLWQVSIGRGFSY